MMPTIERQHMAHEFAQYTESRRGVEPWMLWAGWASGVGCDWCREYGTVACCWSEARCHDYLRGCHCERCCTQQELEQLRRAAAEELPR